MEEAGILEKITRSGFCYPALNQAILIGPSRAAGKLERSKACVGSSSRSGPPRREAAEAATLTPPLPLRQLKIRKRREGCQGHLNRDCRCRGDIL